MTDFSCQIDNPDKVGSNWEITMKERFAQLRELFPQVDDTEDLQIYLFENVCEEYENIKETLTRDYDHLNYCGIDINLITIIENNLKIKIKAEPPNRQLSKYIQTNPTQNVDISVDNFIEQLHNLDLDIPTKFLVVVSHSHFMKALLKELDQINEDKFIKRSFKYEPSKIETKVKFDIQNYKTESFKRTIEKAKNNDKKPGKIYFNNFDILGIVRLKIRTKNKFIILDTFILHNYENYTVHNNKSFSNIDSLVKYYNNKYGISKEDINIIFLTRHCVACHNILNFVEKPTMRGMVGAGWNKYSMCIPDELVSRLHTSKMDGLIKSFKNINNIYFKEDITNLEIINDTIFGCSFIFRSILSITLFAKVFISRLSTIMRSNMKMTDKEMFCPTEYTQGDLIWIDDYSRDDNTMNNCESKYLQFDYFTKVEPDDTFETYMNKIRNDVIFEMYFSMLEDGKNEEIVYEKMIDDGISQDNFKRFVKFIKDNKMERYSSYIDICNNECTYNDKQVNKIKFVNKYI